MSATRGPFGLQDDETTMAFLETIIQSDNPSHRMTETCMLTSAMVILSAAVDAQIAQGATEQQARAFMIDMINRYFDQREDERHAIKRH